MSKWYEITVTTSLVYAVEVKDTEGEDDAMQVASDEGPFDGVTDIALQAGPITDAELLASVKRHADKVLELPPE